MAIRFENGKLILVLRGVLDLESVRRLTEAALGVDGRDVVIDLRNVREIHDSALVDLIMGLNAADRRFELRGLSEHQRRLLTYLHLEQSVNGYA